MIMTRHDNTRARSHRRHVHQRLLFAAAAFIVASTAQPFTDIAQALESSSGSSAGLVVGAYNVLHCFGEGAPNYKTRQKTVAQNIQTLGYDVVGMSEYNYYNCDGMILSALNAGGTGPWQESKQYAHHYGVNQTSLIWNSSVVTMISDDIFDMDDPGNTNLSVSSHDGSCDNCGGGRWAHISRFKDRNGKEFVVANGHFAMKHGNQGSTHRVKEITNLMNKLKPETAPVFIVGDTNASSGNSSNANEDSIFYKAVTDGGYFSADTTASQSQNALYSTIGNSSTKNSNNHIDRVFYRNVSAPSYFEVFGCVGIAQCGTDHRPIKAVFNDLAGSGGAGCSSSGGTLDSEKQLEFKEWNIVFYDPTLGACCNTVTTSSSLVGDTNAEKAYSFLTTTSIKTNGDKPLSSAQAAGAVGNLMRESGGDTYALKPDASNGSHFGIVQWGGGRYTGLKNLAESKGTKWTDLKTQLEFIVYELEHGESAIVKDSAFQGVSNDDAGARKAAERWDTLYERSGGAGLDKRENNAAKAFADFGDSGATNTGSDEVEPSEEDTSGDETTLSSTSTAGADNSECTTTSSGEYVFPLTATQQEVRKWGNDPGTTEWTSGRYHERTFDGYYAVDIYAPEGTPVVAFHSGKVIKVDTGSYGEVYIEIIDTDGYTYFYTHMSNSRGAKVKENAQVEAGTLIGYVGNKHEGWDTVPHLHIDKSKNPGSGLRGTCTASHHDCPIASEHRFVKIVTELHDSFGKLSESGVSGL